jgi:ATP-binding cassette subfamily B protein
MTGSASSGNDHPAVSWASFAGLPRAFALVWATHRGLTLALAATTAMQSMVPVALAWVTKLIIDGVVGADPRGGLGQIMPIVALAIAIALFEHVLTNVRRLCEELLRDLVGQSISAKVLDKAISLDVPHFDNPTYYDLLQRVQQEAPHRPLAILQEAFSLLRGVLTLLSFVAILTSLGPWLVLLVIVSCFPVLFVHSSFGRAYFNMQSHRAPAWRRLLYHSLLLSDRLFVKEVRLFGLGPMLLDRHNRLYRQFFQEDRELAVKRSLAEAILDVVALAGYYGAYAVVIARAIRAEITLGDLTMYGAILLQTQLTVSGLMATIAGLYEQNLFLSNLSSFLALTPRIVAKGAAKTAPETLRSGIVFEDVSFHYSGCDRPVLGGLSFSIRPGEKLAVVGENGAGKTTLIKLLARFYDPTSGRILLDGVDLREYEPASLHRRIAIIFQDFVQYPFSVRENIGFGQVDKLDDEARIRSAAAKSGADQVIEGLPHGYDTVLGRWFDEEGPDLSLGQWQKLALARAHMRDAPLLILDEPTASLDARAEYEIFQRFRDLTADRTVLLISHRFSTVRMADRIVVLGEGRVAEEGTHAELVAAGGIYARMFAMQAEGYL